MGNNEKTAIRLLKDLVSLQNGAPLESYKEEYDKLMNEIYAFIDSHSPTSEKNLQVQPDYYPGHEYQGLFNLMHEQYGLILLVSEMQDIADEVRKMDSHSPTVEQYDTLQEGDWFTGTEEDYRKVLEIEDLITSYNYLQIVVKRGFIVYSDCLHTNPNNRKTKLTTEEFLRRAENTFKNQNQ